jgi:hypothetical protein
MLDTWNLLVMAVPEIDLDIGYVKRDMITVTFFHRRFLFF